MCLIERSGALIDRACPKLLHRKKKGELPRSLIDVNEGTTRKRGLRGKAAKIANDIWGIHRHGKHLLRLLAVANERTPTPNEQGSATSSNYFSRRGGPSSTDWRRLV